METVGGKAERSNNALLIIDVQVGLVELIPPKFRLESYPESKLSYPEPALPGHP